MAQPVETVIVGGGQAGLALAYELGRLGRERVVLEQASAAGNAWRTDRWDSFCLVTPNWSFQLPGAAYDESEPDRFMPRDEVVARLETYVDRYRLPVRYRTRVTSVASDAAGRGYRVEAEDERWRCDNVVIATGLFQRPRIPAVAAQLSPGILQLPSGRYRNPDSLPPGAVLVVGSAQSGCQIAEELYLSGRRVFLCVGRAGRAPRRYRGQDIFTWLKLIGFFKRTVDQLESPREKFRPNPYVSGARGGHSLNLHQFARDGVVLLGRLQAADSFAVQFAPDLNESLSQSDRFELELTGIIDRYIERSGTTAPPEELPQWRDGYEAPIVDALDLRAAGIGTIIWATGYHFDYSLVRLPVTDGDGFPLQKRGVTAYPGLYFLGMPWMPSQASGLLMGVGEAAAHVAAHITARMTGA